MLKPVLVVTLRPGEIVPTLRPMVAGLLPATPVVPTLASYPGTAYPPPLANRVNSPANGALSLLQRWRSTWMFSIMRLRRSPVAR